MAESEALPSIMRHGLRSTAALLDLFEVEGERRSLIENRRRPEMVTLSHPVHGTAIIRDNKPMYDAVLARTLVGFSVSEWYSFLNGRVFFWVERSRLERLRSAAAYRERRHLILEVDTARLLARHASSVRLSTMNSGATHPGARYSRGIGTFEPLHLYRWAERLKTHPREPVVELTVDYAVPNVMDLVVDTWTG